MRRIEPAGSPARYEARAGDNHHHLICRSCGRTVDVDCAVGDTPCLTAADDSGYEIDEAEVIYWGRCPECVAASRARRERFPTPEASGRSTDVPDTGSESENPVIPSPTPKVHGPMSNRDWWPDQLDLQVLHQHSTAREPDGRRLRLRGRVRDARRRGAEARPRRAHDRRRRSGGPPTTATTARCSSA